MKNIKFWASAFCIGASLFVGSGSVFAASQINNAELAVENQLRADANDNSPLNHGHNYYKLKLNVSVNQQVANGDYLEIETRGFPFLGSRDVFANGNSTTPIGKITQIIEDMSTREKQFRLGARTPEFDALHPEDGRVVKYKVVFNENAENLNDIRFSFGGNNLQENSAITDRDYNLRHRVLLNGVEKYSKDTPVNKVNKGTIKTSEVWHYRTNVNLDERDNNRTILSYFGYQSGEDLSGSTVEITLPDDSMMLFNKDQASYVKKQNSSFIFTDSSYVNPHGVIADNGGAKLDSEVISVEDRKITIRINDQGGGAISSGLSQISMMMTPEGAAFLKANNDLPPIPYTMTIKKDGAVKFNKTNNGKPIVKGTTNDFSSIVRQPEPKKPEQPEVPESQPQLEPTEKKEKVEEVKAPNTGVKNSNESAFYGIIAMLAVLSAGIIFKKKAVIKF